MCYLCIASQSPIPQQGAALQDYLAKNTANFLESQLVTGTFGLFTLLGVLAIAKTSWDNLSVPGPRTLFLAGCTSFTSYHAAKLMFMHTHFQQDILYMTGAIIHHAEAKHLGLDKKGGSVTQGYLLCGLVNQASTFGLQTTAHVPLASWHASSNLMLLELAARCCCAGASGNNMAEPTTIQRQSRNKFSSVSHVPER
jgi:hypothetical protein